jgi:hypothetical protein
METIEEYVKSIKTVADEFRKSGKQGAYNELSFEEKVIIYAYSDNYYEDLNEQLRDSKGTKLKPFGHYLRTALSKLPNYVGLVFRGVDMDNSSLQRYQEDAIITEYSFLSTSQDPKIADQFKKNVFFTIFSDTGKVIEKVSKRPIEHEVLFVNNTEFKVLDVTKEGNSTLITMEEIKKQ